ncbi:MAG: site-specific tyrosine recombinase XerC [Deltaproteobacteria bacterium]|nr:site-specific tyrosine recombinase XerC [Deltaproteobacteria bacterium]MBK6687710.1 site-specific tyrosine recombinase XerC [Deltaproteobacteria bacterium]
MPAKKLPPGDPFDAEGFLVRSREYHAWMETRNYSAHTIKNSRRTLNYFIQWCADRDLSRPTQITKAIVERYARHLFEYRKPSGTPLTFRSQYARLSNLRGFFRFLARRNVVLFSPAQDLELPRLGYQLPRVVLTHEEMEKVLGQPDTRLDHGVRDRAIMETFYSTGIRRSELVNLETFDVDAARRTVTVRQGKGKKDRFVPIGERALDWIDRYLRTVRVGYVVDPEQQRLFLTAYGEPLSVDGLTHTIGEYVTAAQLGKTGSCHLFRHTMATQMLERGADVRLIQEILGHANLDATQIYTHVSIRQLIEVHAATHPTAKREVVAEGDELAVAEAADEGAEGP